MGAVYEAVRADDEFTQRVAIKVMHPASGEGATRRLRREHLILARLTHPNIATFIEGGMTAAGEPYFAMEYIPGVPLTTWCRTRRLSVRERLIVFLQVCRAVEYAHRHLVVHCDLKPANILVTAEGAVKLLDFGIARLLHGDDGDALPPPSTGRPAFTADYAAPEQLDDLTAASTSPDIYALGCLLFELLTGRRVFLFDNLLRPDIEAMVRHQPPDPPSSVVTDELARGAGLPPVTTLRRHLRGDLDAIVMMALRKDPRDRYGSVAQLERDITAALDGLPVAARPDSLSYRVTRLLRRHRLEITMALLVLIALGLGVIRTAAEARRAIAEGAQASAATRYFTAMLAAPAPSEQAIDQPVLMRTVLDAAAQRADSLRPQPQLDLHVRRVLSTTYLTLGDYAAAAEQSEQGVNAARRLQPFDPEVLATMLANLSTALEMDGRIEEADSVLSEALQLLSRYGRTEAPGTASYLDHRGRLLSRLGDLPAALPLLRHALELQAREEPDNDSALAYAHHNLAALHGQLGNTDSALRHFTTALALERRAFDGPHPLLASTLNSYAGLLDRIGQPEAAESTFFAALQMRRTLLGPTHPDYAWTMYNYADELLTLHRPAEAAAWARQVVALRDIAFTDSHPAVASAMQVLGRALGAMDSLDAAESWLRHSLTIREQYFPEGHWLIASSQSLLADQLRRNGRYPEAEHLLLQAQPVLSGALNPDHPAVLEVRQRLIALYQEWGRPGDAARWQSLDSASVSDDP